MDYPLNPLTGGVAEWTQLTQVEQASNAIDDPGAYTTTGTAFDGDTFTWVMTGDAAVVSGYQHNWAGWSIPLLTLIPDFTIGTHELELGLEILSMPLSLAKYGFQFGLCDGPIGTRASIAAAGGLAVFPNSATNTNGGLIGPLGLGSNNGLAASSVGVTEIRSRKYLVNSTTPAIRVTGSCSRTSGGDADVPAAGAIGASFAGALADWRVFIGHAHLIGTSATPTLIARLWYRGFESSGLPFP